MVAILPKKIIHSIVENFPKIKIKYSGFVKFLIAQNKPVKMDPAKSFGQIKS